MAFFQKYQIRTVLIVELVPLAVIEAAINWAKYHVAVEESGKNHCMKCLCSFHSITVRTSYEQIFIKLTCKCLVTFQ